MLRPFLRPKLFPECSQPMLNSLGLTDQSLGIVGHSKEWLILYINKHKEMITIDIATRGRCVYRAGKHCCKQQYMNDVVVSRHNLEIGYKTKRPTNYEYLYLKKLY